MAEELRLETKIFWANSPYDRKILGFVMTDISCIDGIIDWQESVRYKDRSYEGESESFHIEVEISWGRATTPKIALIRESTRRIGTRPCQLPGNYEIKRITIYGSRDQVDEFEERVNSKRQAHPEKPESAIKH